MKKLVSAALCAGLFFAIGCGSSTTTEGPTVEFRWTGSECPNFDPEDTAVVVFGDDVEFVGSDVLAFDCSPGSSGIVDIPEGTWIYDGQVVFDLQGRSDVACFDNPADPDCLIYSDIDTPPAVDTLVSLDSIVDFQFADIYAYAAFDVEVDLDGVVDPDATDCGTGNSEISDIVVTAFLVNDTENIFDDSYACADSINMVTRELPLDDYDLEFDFIDLVDGTPVNVDPVIPDNDAGGVCVDGVCELVDHQVNEVVEVTFDTI